MPGVPRTTLGSLRTPSIVGNPFQTIFSDGFNRTDTSTGSAGTSTGGGNGWIDVTGGVAQILSNQLRLTGDGVDGNQYLRTFVLRPTAEAFINGRIECTSAASGWDVNGSHALILRKVAGVQTYLFAKVKNDGSDLQIYKSIAGAVSLVVGSGTIASFSTSKTYKMVFEAYDLDVTLSVYDVTGGQDPICVGAISSQSLTGVTAAGSAGFTADWQVVGASVLYDNVVISSRSILKIGFTGDSILAVTPPSGFISTGEAIALGLSLRTGKDYLISNQAVVGRTSADALTNIATDIAAFSAAGITDVFVLLGANDSTAVNAVSTATYVANMTSIRNSLLAAGFKVHLLYCTYADPVNFAGRDYTNQGRLQGYNVALPALANGINCFINGENPFEYMRANGGTSVLSAADGVHPTNAGQYRLATIWANGALSSGRF